MQHFKKYIRMKGMLPEGAVRQKMTADGYATSDIERFLSGQVNFLPFPSPQSAGGAAGGAPPPPRPNLAAMLQQTPALRSAPPPAAGSKPSAGLSPPRMSLLDEIQQGPKLKAVIKDDARMKSPGAGGGVGGAGAKGITGGGGPAEPEMLGRGAVAFPGGRRAVSGGVVRLGFSWAALAGRCRAGRWNGIYSWVVDGCSRGLAESRFMKER